MASRPPRWQALLAELKRRRVFRVMTVYGIVGFAVLQGADLLVPVLLLPAWTYRLIGILLLAGFPIAIALAWVFELGPEGLRRTDPAPVHELASIAAAPRRHRWPAGLFALIGTLLLLAGAWFTFGGDRSAGATAADAAATPDSANDAPSLAVLPFANLSHSEAAAPFVEGVHDDLLTQLSKMGSVRVISRTSVQSYRNTTKNIREIAAELGVTHVLEGGVQRADTMIRINAQLIDARTDQHLWADTYTRTLTVANVFALQTEIAGAIATAMHAHMGSDHEVAGAQPTESLVALDHYQRGLAFFRRTLIASDVRAAIREFESAVRIDPGFADAWARLAIARLSLSWDFGVVGEAVAAESAVRRAESLAPDRLLTHLARGYYHYYGRREYDAALAAFARAEAIAPDDPAVLLPAGWVLRRMGRWEDAIAKFEAAHARDPRNWDNVHASMAESLITLRRYAETARYHEIAISIAPEMAGTHSSSALLHLLLGDTAAAAAAVERGASHAGLARVVFDYAAVSRTLAPRFGNALRKVTSDVASQATGLNSIAWVGQDLTLPAFFLQKAHMLRALGDVGAARAHFDSARAILEPLAARMPADAVWSDQGGQASGLGVAYAGLGRKEDAIRYGRAGLDAVLRVGDALTEPMRRAELAEIYVTVGEHELALAELERLLARPGMISAELIRADPIWKPLRPNPRFQRLR